MSFGELVSDVFHGNLTNAYSRLVDWYNGWPPQLKAFVSKLTDDEGQILWAAAQTAVSGGLAGKTINEIADELWPVIETQVPNKAKSDFLDALGLLVRST